MPIRIASLHRQIEKSGAKLHRAVLSRIHSHGTDDAPSDQERALIEERRILWATVESSNSMTGSRLRVDAGHVAISFPTPPARAAFTRILNFSNDA